jgi:hypothetical protein
MLVKDLIDQLQKKYSPDTELAVAYWDKELVERIDKQTYDNALEQHGAEWLEGTEPMKLTDEEWGLVVEKFEDSEHSWQSEAFCAISEYAEEVKND